jgi:hypothetical protein
MSRDRAMASSCVKSRDRSTYLVDLAQCTVGHRRDYRGGDVTKVGVREKRFGAGCWSDEGSCNGSHATLSCKGGEAGKSSPLYMAVQERTLQPMLSGMFAFRCLALATTTAVMALLHRCCYRSASVPGRNEGVRASFVPYALVSRVGTDGQQFEDTAMKHGTTAFRPNSDTNVFYKHTHMGSIPFTAGCSGGSRTPVTPDSSYKLMRC